MEQIAKLYLRGSLINGTAKNMSQEEIADVNNLHRIMFNHSLMQNQKYEFCMFLGATIGGEYKNHIYALQEAHVAIWKTAVNVVSHIPKTNMIKSLESKNFKVDRTDFYNISLPEAKEKFKSITGTDHVDPKSDLELRCDKSLSPEEVVNSEEARLKYFKTFLWNYMKQILNENKFSQKKLNTTVSKETRIIIKDIIESIVQNEKGVKIDYDVLDYIKGEEFGYKFNFNTLLLSLKNIDRILNLGSNYKLTRLKVTKNSILIASDDVSIANANITVNNRTFNINSSNKNDGEESTNVIDNITTDKNIADDSNSTRERSIIEDEISNNDELNTLRCRLSSGAKDVFNLITNTPKEFENRFGCKKKISKSHIAEYLDISPKEVTRRYHEIKIQCTALDLIPSD